MNRRQMLTTAAAMVAGTPARGLHPANDPRVAQIANLLLDALAAVESYLEAEEDTDLDTVLREGLRYQLEHFADALTGNFLLIGEDGRPR